MNNNKSLNQQQNQMVQQLLSIFPSIALSEIEKVVSNQGSDFEKALDSLLLISQNTPEKPVQTQQTPTLHDSFVVVQVPATTFDSTKKITSGNGNVATSGNSGENLIEFPTTNSSSSPLTTATPVEQAVAPSSSNEVQKSPAVALKEQKKLEKQKLKEERQKLKEEKKAKKADRKLKENSNNNNNDNIIVPQQATTTTINVEPIEHRVDQRMEEILAKGEHNENKIELSKEQLRHLLFQNEQLQDQVQQLQTEKKNTLKWSVQQIQTLRNENERKKKKIQAFKEKIAKMKENVKNSRQKVLEKAKQKNGDRKELKKEVQQNYKSLDEKMIHFVKEMREEMNKQRTQLFQMKEKEEKKRKKRRN